MDENQPRQTGISLARFELVVSLALGGIFGGLIAALVTLMLTRDAVAATMSGMIVAGATFATLWPIMLLRNAKPNYVAAGALGMSVGRMLAVLGIGLAADLMMELPRQGFWLGVLSGAIVVLTIETVALLLVIRSQLLVRPERSGSHA